MEKRIAAEFEEVQLLLDDWNMPELKEIFKREEITLRALDCLQENDKDLIEIVPKFGLRKVFWSYLKEWKKTRKATSELMNETPNLNATNVVHSTPILQPMTTLTQDVSNNVKDEETVVSKSKPVLSKPKDHWDLENLEFWFKQNPQKADEIQKYYRKNGALDKKHQSILVHLIMVPLYEHTKFNKNRREIWKALAAQIEQRFPGENKDAYAGTSLTEGKFRSKHKQLAKKERDGQYIKPENSESKQNSTNFENVQPSKSAQKMKMETFLLPHSKTVIKRRLLTLDEAVSATTDTQHSKLQASVTRTTKQNKSTSNEVRFDENVNLIELLDLDPEKSNAIEESFYEKGRIDSQHRSLLVCLLIRLLYSSILDQHKRTTVLTSLSEQIALHYPGEDKEIYLEKLKVRFRNVRKDRKDAKTKRSF